MNLCGFQHETELLEDSLALPGFPSFPGKFGSSEEEFVDSDDVAYGRQNARQNTPFADSKLVMVSPGTIKREFRRRNAPYGWLQKLVNYHLCQIKVISSFTFSLLARMDVGFLP